MIFKAVIFDFDGVLIDSEIVNIEAGAKAFAEFGYELTQEDRTEIVGRSSLDHTKIFQKKFNFSEETREALLKKIAEEYDLMFEGLIKLQPHVKETLEFLRGKEIISGIATTNRRHRVEMFFKKYGLENYFGFAITNEDLTRRKPDPEAYLLAKSRTGFKDDEILAIEDTEYGVTSAKDASLKCAAIPTHLTKGHNFSRADYVFSSMIEVEGLFK